jgi:hypothetical protein
MLAHRNRTAALWVGAAGVIAAVIAALTVGGRGPGSALLGVVMVLAFFGAGSLPFLVVGDGTRPGLAFIVLGMTYVLRILLGVIAYGVATSMASIHSRTVGLTVIACAMVWTSTHVVLGLSRRHQPVLEV